MAGGKAGVLNRLYRSFTESGRYPRPRVMERAEQIAADDPDLLAPLAPRALERSLSSPYPVVAARPQDYVGRLASRLDPIETETPGDLEDLMRYVDELSGVAREGGFSSMPALWLEPGHTLGREAHTEVPALFSRGHEGRHRSLALDDLDFPGMLIELNPHRPTYGTGENPIDDIARLLEKRVPFYGQDEYGKPWTGGADFPFLSRYRRGGGVGALSPARNAV